MIEENIQRLTACSSDFDEFAAMIGNAHIEEHLLEQGVFQGQINQVASSHVLISQFTMNRKMLQVGASIPGYITFVIWNPTRLVHWRNQEMTRGMVGVLWNKEHHSITGSGLIGFPVSIEENFFMNCAKSKGYADLIDKLRSSEVLRVNDDKIQKVRDLIMFIVNNLAFDSQSIHHLLEYDLIDAIFDFLAEALPTATKKDRSSLRFTKAVDYIHDNLDNITSIREVTEVTKVPERTLRDLFSKKYGISPKNYLQRLRLNAVHKLMKAESATANITEISSEFNFWHMGQFSKDYKRLFGKLPSQTVAEATIS